MGAVLQLQQLPDFIEAESQPLRRLHDRQGAAGFPAHHAREPGQVHHPAGRLLQGAAGPHGPPGRRAMVQRGALVAERHAGSRGIRHHVQERGRDAQEHQPQCAAHPGRDAGHGQEPGGGGQVGVQHHQAHWQLRRKLRKEPGPQQPAEAAARLERVLS
ncbi:hypothetical protein G6F60_013750 [Rhizopus arrhizus]|nr:hypothetical protein G6F60_013750 [Rhizopus arrhizus]